MTKHIKYTPIAYIVYVIVHILSMSVCRFIAVVIVWRVRGKTIRSVLCNIVCNNCAQCDAHIYKQTNSSLDWVLSHWAHFTVLRFIFYCVLLCVVCMLSFVTR